MQKQVRKFSCKVLIPEKRSSRKTPMAMMMMQVLHNILYCPPLATRMGRDRKQQGLPIIVANELQEVLSVIENCISKISNYIHDSKKLSETSSTTSKTPKT